MLKSMDTMKPVRLLLWFSVYCIESIDQLLSKPNELCAKELSTVTTESINPKCTHVIRLKIPLPITPLTTVINREDEHNSKESSSSLIIQYDSNMINLLTILYQIVLPISYEYEPDLICLLIGSNNIENRLITSNCLAQILYLLNGLGKVVLVHGYSINEFFSNYSIQSLQEMSISMESMQITPSTKMKQIIQLIMQQNQHRWKCLNCF
ncbi:hypothetical protein EWB00_003204 [Schistosoma japonicum]|uniref:Uncharacterized protein n=1 Tax=Schistosoma japonicum TaxID=6182 RepID=A0A4Z2DA80_SCHJA|nr:hypothetical protein EWB00_003204 [Schistosoma japonicum]